CPLRANASGSISMRAIASMKPAPNATTCSISLRPRAACRTTSRAPSTFPVAAMSAYHSALDTGEQILAGVARRILEHVAEQPLQRLPDVRSRPHPRREEVVALHGEVLQRERIPRRADRRHHLRQPGHRKREA